MMIQRSKAAGICTSTFHPSTSAKARCDERCWSSFQPFINKEFSRPSTVMRRRPCFGLSPVNDKPCSAGSKVRCILALMVVLIFHSRCVSSVRIDASAYDIVSPSELNLMDGASAQSDEEGLRVPILRHRRKRSFVDSSKETESDNKNIDDDDDDDGDGDDEDDRYYHKISNSVAFTRDVYEAKIVEGSFPRTFLNTNEMMGIFLPSPPPGKSLNYRATGASFHIISGDDDDKAFKAESKMVGNFVFLRLRTRSTGYINREQRSVYNLTVGARVKHSSRFGDVRKLGNTKQEAFAFEAFATVLVSVVDSNDLGPMFEESEYSASLPDHAPLHHEVARVSAWDSDLGVNSDIYYQLDEASREDFAIHPNLGSIILLKRASKLRTDYYEIVVMARDRGLQDHGHTGRTKVKVKVVAENRHAPVIKVLLQRSEFGKSFRGHVALAFLEIVDADFGRNGEISSVSVGGSCTGDFFELQNVTDNSSSGEKRIQVVLIANDSMPIEDHQRELACHVTAIDGGLPPKSTSKEIKFSIGNDFNLPGRKKTSGSGHFSIMKCHPPGSLIGHVEKLESMDGTTRYEALECVNGGHAPHNSSDELVCHRTRRECDCSLFFTSAKINRKKFHAGSAKTRGEFDALNSRHDPLHYVVVHPRTGAIKILKSLRNLPVDVDGLRLLVLVEHSKQAPVLLTLSIRLVRCNDHGPIFDEPLDGQVVVKEDVPPNTLILRASARDADAGDGVSVIGYSIFNAHGTAAAAAAAAGEVNDSYDDGDFHDSSTTGDFESTDDDMSAFPFAVDHLTGFVYTTAHLDFDFGQRAYEFYLRASDDQAPYPRHTNSKPIRVTVADVNDNSPYFNLSKVSCFVSRSTRSGSVVTSIFASDVDTVGGPLTYEVSSDPDDESWDAEANGESRMECFDPQIVVSGRLDLILKCNLKEITRDRFRLVVSASDGVHRSEEPLVVEVKVVESRTSVRKEAIDDEVLAKSSDVVVCETSPNPADRRPPPPSSSRVAPGRAKKHRGRPTKTNTAPTMEDHLPFHVRENAPVGTAFGKVVAFDPDLAYDGLLQFSIVQGSSDDGSSLPGGLEGWELFSIDVDTGRLRVAAPLDRELLILGAQNSTIASFDVTVKVCDMAALPLCSEKNFEIFLDDVNDNKPRFDRSLYKVDVREDVPVGHSILRIFAKDSDSGNNGKVIYSSISGSNYFSLHPTSGEITTSLKLDREFMDKHEFKVVAKDSGGENQLTTEVPVLVMVRDVNDNRPTFLKESFKFQILEDLPAGSVVGVVHASDPDDGEAGETNYLLVDDDGDDERRRSTNHPFAIDRHSGAILLLLRANLQPGRVYDLKVKAVDKGRPPLDSDECSVRISVVPVNRNRHAPLFKDFVRECFVRENLPAGSSVVHLQAVDKDANDPTSPPENYQIEYSTRSGTGLGFFVVDSRGVVRTSRALDREVSSSYWLTVYAQDAATSPLGSSVHLLIRVLDENDNRPVFHRPIYRFAVVENSPPRTWVGQVESSDDDLPSKTGMTFHILNKPSLFFIDRKTGVIRTTSKLLDREVKEEHKIEVVVKDNSDDRCLSSTTLVVVSVTDLNDNPPRFFDSPYLEILLPILGPANSDHHLRHHHRGHDVQRALYQGLLAVQAYDLDDGTNSRLEYSLEVHSTDGIAYDGDDGGGGGGDGGGGDGEDSNANNKTDVPQRPLLSIDPESGNLFISRSLEEGEQIYLHVHARDGGLTSLSSSIKVTIGGVKMDHEKVQKALRFVDDSCGRVHILEDGPPSDMVCLAIAKYMRGDDGGVANSEDGLIWYYIAAGNDAGKFGINWRVGSLRQLKRLNMSNERFFNLTIVATDGLTAVSMQSLIFVVDSNNHDPRFEISKYHFNVTLNRQSDENLGKSIKIGQVKAVDEDDFDDGRLIYDIVSVVQFPDKNFFLIHPDSGLMFLNFETNFNGFGCHAMVVEAKNRPSTLRPVRRDFAQVSVCVDDGSPDNRAPQFTTKKYSGKVEWWKGIGEEILRVKAVDWDFGLSGQVRYSLEEAGKDNKLFSLDSYTGSIVLSSRIRHGESLVDFVQNGSGGDDDDDDDHTVAILTVRATDSGFPELFSSCIVEIDLSTFVDAQDLKFETDDLELEISENVRPGSYVGLVACSHSRLRVLYHLECLRDHERGIKALGRSESSSSSSSSSSLSSAGNHLKPRRHDDEEDDRCPFSIDAFTGILTTSQPLDREVESHHRLKITASVSGIRASFGTTPQLPSPLTRLNAIHTLVDVLVEDENDNAPRFSFPEYRGWLYESSESKRYLLSLGRMNEPLVLKASDLDAGKNAVVGMKIVDRWADKFFEIVPSESSIRTKLPLDREAILFFQEVFGDRQGYFNPAEFERIPEVTTSCVRGNVNESVESFMFHGYGSPAPSCYNWKLPLDWPGHATLRFKIEAFDHGAPQLVSRADVVVEVHDVNNKSPKIIHPQQTIEVQPPLITAFKIAKVVAFDPDYRNSKLKYFLDGGHPSNGNYFHLDETTGWISTTDKLCDDHHVCLREEVTSADHLKTSHGDLSFQLKVKVTDGVFFSSSLVDIKILGSSPSPAPNDLRYLRYENLIYRTEALENTTDVQFLTRLDLATHAFLTFKLLNFDDLFAVHSHSGIVETKKDRPLDRERKDCYDLLVEVKDHDFGHVTRCLVVVKIRDVNDNPPLFLALPYVAIVDVNTPLGDVVFQPIVTDFDDGSNAEMTFSLTSTNSTLLVVNEKSGQIVLAEQANDLIGQKIVFVMKAEDRGSPPLSSETEIVLYFKADTHPHFDPPERKFSIKSDHPPLINFASVSAHSSNGAKLVYTLVDDDHDVASEDDPAWTSTNGHHRIFDVDLHSGSLMTLHDISDMAGRVIPLVIKATDTKNGFHAFLRAEIEIVETIKDPPSFVKIHHEVFLTPFLLEGQTILEPEMTNERRMNGSSLLYKVVLDPSWRESIIGRLTEWWEFERLIAVDAKSGSVRVGKVKDFERLCSIGHVDFLLSAYDLSDPSLSSSSIISAIASDGNNYKIEFTAKRYETKLEISSANNGEDKRKHFEVSITRISASLFGCCNCLEAMSWKEIFYSLVGDSLIYRLNRNVFVRFLVDRKTGIIKATVAPTTLTVTTTKTTTPLPGVVVLNVSASTSSGLLDFSQVRVNVTVENLWAPRFGSHLYVLHLNDSLPPGSVVLETNVVDEDFYDGGHFEKLTFGIESCGKICAHFRIDSRGRLYISKRLAGSSGKEFYLYITVADRDGYSSESKVIIKIHDDRIREKAAILDKTAYDVNVNANSDIGSVVFTIAKPKGGYPPEVDSIPGKPKFFLFPEKCLGDNEGNYFAFDGQVGSITQARSLTHLENSSFNCFMRLSASLSVQITINVIGQNAGGDAVIGHLSWTNHTGSGGILDDLGTVERDYLSDHSLHDLEFNLDYYVFYIAENLNPGVAIGRVNLTRSFPEGRVNFLLKGWSNQSLLMNIENFFNLDRESGHITSATSFDFESSTFYDFYVTAFDSEHELNHRDVQVRINVIDVNDNHPTFIQDEKHKIAIEEDVAVGSVILKLLASDRDSSSAPIFFIKEGNPCGRFDLTTSGELTLVRSLDREATPAYELLVVAFDGRWTAETMVEVDVLDVNDNRPSCRETPYRLTLAENTSIGSTFLQIVSSDNDVVQSHLLYEIEPIVTGIGQNVASSENNDQSSELFAIDKTNGFLSIKANLDREIKSEHEFWVKTSDEGGLFCRSKVLVTVEDVDDEPPRFVKSHFEGKLDENGPIGEAVMKVLAIDKDKGGNAAFQYFLEDDRQPSLFLEWLHSSSRSSSPPPTSFYFTIGPGTGVISAKVSFDRELRSLYNATVYAVAMTSNHLTGSETMAPLWSSASVTIAISDVNDNPPTFTRTSYEFRVPEDAKAGSIVGTVTAVCIDEGLNALVSYALVNFDSSDYPPESPSDLASCRDLLCGVFSVDSRTGHLILKASLDYENVKDYHFMVVAYDSGTPPLSGIAKVTIVIDDVNDNAPVILLERNLVEVYENVTVGSILLKISAVDKDSSTNGMVNFKITSGNGAELFHLGETTGDISTRGLLDREKVSSWNLQVAAYDLGKPSLTTYSTIQVSVLDVNDCPPQMDATSLKGFQISENVKPGESLIQLLVEDCDEEPNSFPFQFSILYVGYDHKLWTEKCLNGGLNYSGSYDVTSELLFPPSAENVFSINRKNVLLSTDETIPYLRSIGFFTNASDHSYSKNLSVVIRIIDNGRPPLFSCESVPISPCEPFHQIFSPVEEITAISIRTEPFKLMLYLYPESENVDGNEYDLTWPPGELGQIKAIVEIGRSNSTLFLDNSSSLLQWFDINYWLFEEGHEEGYDCFEANAFETHSHRVFQVDKTSGAIHSLIPLDPGSHAFEVRVGLTMKDRDNRTMDCKSEASAASVEVEVVPMDLLQDAVAVRLLSGSYDEDDGHARNTAESALTSATVARGSSEFVEAMKQRRGLDVKILGIDFKFKDDNNRSKRSSVSPSLQEWVELLISASNRESGGRLQGNELSNILSGMKSLIKEDIGWQIVNITRFGNTLGPWSCDKENSNECFEINCTIDFVIDKKFSLPIKFSLADSPSYIQIVPKFWKKSLCICPDGRTINENDKCQTEQFGEYEVHAENIGNNALTFSGQSFFAWHSSLSLERKLFISFDILTNQTTGRILHLAGPMDYSILEVESGHLQFRWNFGSGPGKVRIQGQRVNDGRWHHATLERSGLNVRLILNSDLVLDAVAPGLNDVLNLEDNKIIFGGEVNHVDRLDVRFGFIGCLKNIVLNGAELIFTDSSHLGYLVNMVNIQHGCNMDIFLDICLSKPCLNGGFCKSKDKKLFECKCSVGFKGRLCEHPALPYDSNHPCLSSSPNPCLNSGTCKPLPSRRYKCSCREGFMGEHCEMYDVAITTNKEMEKDTRDGGSTLVPTQISSHIVYLIILVACTTALICAVVIVIICLCHRMNKKKGQVVSTHLESNTNNQNKINNLICQLKKNSDDAASQPIRNIIVNNGTRDTKNMNNSNNRCNFVNRRFDGEDFKNDKPELEPLNGYNFNSKRGSAKDRCSEGSTISIKNGGGDSKMSMQDVLASGTSLSTEEVKAQPICVRSRNLGSSNVVITCNPYRGHLDKRTLSENVNINFGFFKRSVQDDVIKKGNRISQVSTPAKLHLTSEDQKSFGIFSKESLLWDSLDLKPNTSSQHFNVCSGLSSEDEKLFDTTLESEQSEPQQTNDTDSTGIKNVTLLARSAGEMSKADLNFYQMAFDTSSVALNDSQ